MSTKNLIFDNNAVTTKVKQYNSNGRDPMVLAEIFNMSKALLSVIATKYYNGDEDLREDLMQEARMQLIKAIPKYDAERNSKLFSFMSAVIRNSMVDFVRKFKPDISIEDEVYDLEDKQHIADNDYINTIVEDMREWFTDRFSYAIRNYLAPELLECLLTDMLDANCGKREAVTNLMEDYLLNKKTAQFIQQVVVIQLKLMTKGTVNIRIEPRKETFEPEYMALVGPELYQRTNIALSGISIKFSDKERILS